VVLEEMAAVAEVELKDKLELMQQLIQVVVEDLMVALLNALEVEDPVLLL
jgi:hypothetical protein